MQSRGQSMGFMALLAAAGRGDGGRMPPPRASVILLASLAAAWAVAATAWGQATQLGSPSDRNGYRLAQYTDSGVVQPGTVIGPAGQDVYDNCYETPGWTGNMFGVPEGQSCRGTGSGIIAGGGAYYIKPFFSDNQAAVLTGTAAGATTINHVGLSNHYNWAPFAFLGFVGPNGFGVRARAAYYNHGSDNLSLTVPAGQVAGSQAPLSALFVPAAGASTGFILLPGATFNASSNLETQVYDLEATQAIDHDHWTWGFSGGARYAIIRQQYAANGSFTPPPGIGGGVQQLTLNSTRQFDGFGPTVSIEGRRTFGQTGIAMYANARGSLLFGNNTQTVTTTNTNFGAPTSVNSTWGQWSTLPILELEAGPEYSVWLGTLRLFIRAGVVGQAWIGAGNASNADLATLPDTHSNLGFFGMRLTGGLDY